MEFLIASLLFHTGFSFLQAGFERFTTVWPKWKLFACSGACIGLACLLGLLIDSGLQLNEHVYEHIFVVFGVVAIVAGLLYVAPPVRFHQHLGGEVVISESLGMMPVLGAYLVQVGDLTRTVYLASLPLVVATGLWVWIDELASCESDEKAGRRTLVLDLGARFSGRYGVLLLVVLLYATLLLAVISGSTSPFALIMLLLGGLAFKIVTISWREHLRREKMVRVREKAYVLHFATCLSIAASSLLTLFI